MAILYALKSFMSSTYLDFVIYTDSLSSVEALDNTFPSNKIIYDIFNLLYHNVDRHVKIGSIKADVGFVGNERADSLGKSVITENIYDEEIQVHFLICFVTRY